MNRTLVAQIKDLRKNYFINADHAISQRNSTSFVSPVDSQYLMDRWIYIKSSVATHTVTRDTDVPTVAQSKQFVAQSMRLNLTATDTSIAAGDYVGFGQIIEGYNWKMLAQRAFTLSFWVKATLAGTYCVAFRNGGADRSYIAEYSISVSEAGTWVKRTITVPASPSAGTWNYTNGSGLRVNWLLAVGSTFQTTAGAWQTGNFMGTSNQVNGVNTGATDFRIAMPIINEGETAAPFRLFSDGSTEDELMACKRHYQKTYAIDVSPGTATLNGAFSGAADANGVSHHFGTKWYVPEMRAIPTITSYRTSGGAPSGTPFTDSDGVSNPFAIAIYDSSHRGFSCHISGASGAGATKYCHLTFEAELT